MDNRNGKEDFKAFFTGWGKYFVSFMVSCPLSRQRISRNPVNRKTKVLPLSETTMKAVL